MTHKPNYFYREWRRAVEGKSDKRPIFVPWYEIDIYRTPPLSDTDRRKLMRSLDTYERELLERHGLEPERIAWYHAKRREYPSHEAMMAEFPSTPEEAFMSAAEPLFPPSILPAPEAEPTAIELAHSARLHVLAVDAPGRPALFTLFSRREGRLLPSADIALSGSLDAILEQAAAAARRHSTPIAILAVSERAEGAARLLADHAFRQGIAIAYDDEERPYMCAPRDLVGRADVALREALSTRRIGETSPRALADYGNYRAERAACWPRVLARMCAVELLERADTSAPDLLEAARDAVAQFAAGC